MFQDPSYPSSECLSPAQIEMVAAFNERIRAGELHMEQTPCLCGSESFDLISTYDRYRVWQPVVICTRCGLVQCQPRMSRETLDWFYTSDFYREVFGSLLPLTDEKFIRYVGATRRRHDLIVRDTDYDAIKRVGEVGCGGGWNLVAFQADGKDVIGCDLSPALTSTGRRHGLDAEWSRLATTRSI